MNCDFLYQGIAAKADVTNYINQLQLSVGIYRIVILHGKVLTEYTTSCSILP